MIVVNRLERKFSARLTLYREHNGGGRLNDIIKISCIGVDDKDVAVISSILKLAPELKGKFELIDTEQKSAANLLFVNADDAEALGEWEAFSAAHGDVVPIVIYSGEAPDIDAITMKRPLAMRRLIDSLKTIISTEREVMVTTTGVGGVKKILVVDDSFPVRKYMEQKLPLLADGELSLNFAESGAEAVERVKETAYDLIFLDVMMDDMNGYKVCKWVKTVRPETVVVMLTSKNSPFDKVRGTMSGCDDYVVKPPKDETLKDILQRF